MDHLFWIILIAGLLAISLAAALHALLLKRDPRSALGWITLCLTVPLFGPLFYWSMGVNRIHRKARQWLESGRRKAGWDSLPASAVQEPAGPLPPWGLQFVELRRLADRVVRAPLVAGNQLAPLQNGEAAYPAMLAAIESANQSVNLSTYIFDGDLTGRQFVAALQRAAERGVEVRVIVDSLGEKYSNPTARKLLKGTKVRVGRFLPLRQGGYVNLRNHRKLLVVDGSLAFTGGMNIGDRHLLELPHPHSSVQDIHFRLTGPVVTYLQRVFLEDWYFVSGELVDREEFFPAIAASGPALCRAVSDGPDKDFRKLHWIIMGALACARERVCIMTPYFIPDRPLITALATTALRGVEVTLILPAQNNLPFVHWATRAYLWELLQHDIKVFYQPAPFVHSKLLLVDGIWSLIGSANLDPRSLRLNFEFNLEVYDPHFTSAMEAKCSATLAISRQITLADADGRPYLEKVRDATAKLFSPYL